MSVFNFIILMPMIIFYGYGAYMGKEANNSIMMVYVLLNTAMIMGIIDKVNEILDKLNEEAKNE